MSSKLGTLPPDLRKLADSLIATKFNEPEVFDFSKLETSSIDFTSKRSSNGYGSNKEITETLVIDPSLARRGGVGIITLIEYLYTKWVARGDQINSIDIAINLREIGAFSTEVRQQLANCRMDISVRTDLFDESSHMRVSGYLGLVDDYYYQS